MAEEKKIILEDSIQKNQVEGKINDTRNAVWKDHMNFDNFIVIASDLPESLDVEITMGFKNPDAEDQHNPATIKGQHLHVDWFRAKEIMSKTKEELYEAYIAKDKTIILE